MPGVGITQVESNPRREVLVNGIYVSGVLPSLEEIQEGLGTWAIVLYSVASATTVILLLQFAVLIRYIRFTNK